MSARYWVIAFVFGLAASLGQSQEQPAPENQPRQQERATDRDNGSGDEQAQPGELTSALERIEAAIRDLVAEEDKIEQERRREQEARDLEAQERMALWAEYMFYATAATVLLTFAALIAIIRTLVHTRRAAESAEGMLVEAKATTKAAEKTVEATREIAHLELRAYVGVRSVTIKFGKDGKDFTAETLIRVSNTGATPATIPFLGAEQQIELLETDAKGLGGVGHSQSNERILGPNSEFEVRLGVGAMRRLMDGPKVRFKVDFFIRFRDIYNEEHVEASQWFHIPVRTDKLRDGMEVSLHPLRQAPHDLKDLSEKKWQ